MKRASSRVRPRESRWSGCGWPLAVFLAGIAQALQIRVDGLFQFRGLGELGVQFGDEARQLFLEGFAVVFDFLSTDIAAGREDVAMRSDVGDGGGFAEAGDVGITGD